MSVNRARPHSTLPKKEAPLATADSRDRLRRLADDCEERGRRSRNAHARNLYHLAASECRLAMPAHDGIRRETLAAMTAQADLARWYDGESAYESARGPVRAFHGLSEVQCPATALSGSDGAPVAAMDARQASQLLNARELGALFGVAERGARKTIERGLRRNLAGFDRVGRLLLAEPDAFERLRMRARTDK